MSNHQILNNIEHKDLKINTEKSAQLGNAQTYSIVFPFEFKHVQADYPIFFLKDDADKINAVALFGFEQNENLYLTEQGWQASYIPLMVEREPFLIGYQNNENNEPQPVIHVDMDSPRVNSESGVEVFLPHGGNSEYINRISTILKTIHDSEATTKLFVDSVAELDLFESFNLDIQLNNGTKNRLTGFHTINEDKLAKLNGEQLEKLNRSGLLHLIYMVIASHANLTALITKKDNLV